MLNRIIFLFLLSVLSFISCSKKTSDSNSDSWTEITPETETTIEVWAWNVAANHLEDTIPSFNAKYPKIKVNVNEFGGPIPLKQKLYIALGANSDLPNFVQIEDYDITVPYSISNLELIPDLKTNYQQVVYYKYIDGNYKVVEKSF